jgi:hypothetical protein
MRVAAVSRLVRRKFLEELYLSRAKCGDWDSLAFYLTRKNDWPIGREMRFFLAAVLRQQKRP